jgi:DNA-binding transcriptional MerR regulator
MAHDTPEKALKLLYTGCAVAKDADIHHVTLNRWVKARLITPLRSSAGAALYTDEMRREVRELARARKAAWRPAKAPR